MYGHYRTRRGSQAPNARFRSPDEVEAARQQIRKRRANQETYEAIARDLGVSINTVRRADQGITYPDDE